MSADAELTATEVPPEAIEAAETSPAARFGSCLPSGPHSRSASSLNMAAITCRPVPTANASRPSFAASAISAIDTIT